MTPRREPGSVRWHRGGWELRVQVDGRRVTRRVKAPNTRLGRQTAEAELDRLVTQLGIGVDGITVAGLLDAYELAARPGWSPSSASSYDVHAAPVLAAFGDTPIHRLTAADIEAAYGRWAAAGASPATVRRRHSILSAALRRAERWQMIATAPTRNVELAARNPKPINALPALEVVLAAIARLDDPKTGNPRLSIAARLAIATASRRGEIAALTWSCLNETDSSITVTEGLSIDAHNQPIRKTTKAHTTKTVAIDAPTLASLKAWRRTIAAQAMAMGGTRPGPATPIVPSRDDTGVPWHPAQITRAWVRRRDGIGLAGMRFHDLRHLAATSALAAGIPAHTVAERLGQSSTKMVHDVYGHAIPAHDRAAADVIARASSPTT